RRTILVARCFPMLSDKLLGRVVSLQVLRLQPQGAYLGNASDENPREILLPRHELPPQIMLGTQIQVFVHLDSEDRPVATLQTPAMTLDEVAMVEVTDLTAFGAFVDIGLRKELLV